MKKKGVMWFPKIRRTARNHDSCYSKEFRAPLRTGSAHKSPVKHRASSANVLWRNAYGDALAAIKQPLMFDQGVICDPQQAFKGLGRRPKATQVALRRWFRDWGKEWASYANQNLCLGFVQKFCATRRYSGLMRGSKILECTQYMPHQHATIARTSPHGYAVTQG